MVIFGQFCIVSKTRPFPSCRGAGSWSNANSQLKTGTIFYARSSLRNRLTREIRRNTHTHDIITGVTMAHVRRDQLFAVFNLTGDRDVSFNFGLQTLAFPTDVGLWLCRRKSKKFKTKTHFTERTRQQTAITPHRVGYPPICESSNGRLLDHKRPPGQYAFPFHVSFVENKTSGQCSDEISDSRYAPVNR